MHADEPLPCQRTLQLDGVTDFPGFAWRHCVRFDSRFRAIATRLRRVQLQNAAAGIPEFEISGNTFHSRQLSQINEVRFKLNLGETFLGVLLCPEALCWRETQ